MSERETDLVSKSDMQLLIADILIEIAASLRERSQRGKPQAETQSEVNATLLTPWLTAKELSKRYSITTDRLYYSLRNQRTLHLI